MKVLMLVAHGSRKQAANDEVVRLATRVEGLGQGNFDAVVPAFLEFANPDIHQGIERCAEMGASEIILVPYFLAAGKHVTRDIPLELECARTRYPHISIETTQYLGENEAMAELVIQCSENIEKTDNPA
jgi:sirohydrochlorin ferrochelatase